MRNEIDEKDNAEANVIAQLVELGYEVFTPLRNNTRTDLVAQDPDGNLYKIQVRRGEKNGETVQSTTDDTRIDTNGTSAREYRDTRVDLTVLYCPEVNQCYCIETDERMTDIELQASDEHGNEGENPGEEYKLENGL